MITPSPLPTCCDEEANAFDRQILDRVRHGHIPDLRRAPACDYFFNNSWRRPAYVELDFGEIFLLLQSAIVSHAGPGPKRVLEVGCGPGHMTLEMARLGHHVTGVDLSSACIDVAQKVAEEDPWKSSRGSLAYIKGDVLKLTDLPSGGFEVVFFVGALHHFAQQDEILDRIHVLLAHGGLILAHEPTRDRVTPGNVALVSLLRTLLSVGGGYFERISPPVDADEIRRIVDRLHGELTYQASGGANTQSPHDNDAGWSDMAPALRRHFDEIVCQDRYAFFHELIGGLRFDDATNLALARSLRAFDAELCRLGVVRPAEFFFVGRRKEF